MLHFAVLSVLPLLALVGVARGETKLVDDAECDCFLINGTVPTYYTKHMFLDFRSLSEYAGVPSIIKTSEGAASASASSDYFTHDNWTDIWSIQTWNNINDDGDGLSGDASYIMANSKSNIYIENNKDEDAASDTYLTLRTRRLPGFQTAVEFQSTPGNFRYVSMRMLARTVGAAGAVTGMFTYRDSTGKLADIQESDIEILTRGPKDKIQYTNQPSYTDDGGEIPRATRNATTPDWSNWVVHRLDWTPDVVQWYVDGERTARIEFQTPKDACDLHFSAWSDGGSWSGNMSMNHEARQEIQWIEMVYNITDKNVYRRDDKTKCNSVCSIDDTTTAGRAAMLWDNAAASVTLDRGSVWTIALALGVAVWIQLWV
ncbi:concanavalin A-like lectin/glucanase domain-containing protein [Thelonectria olida]|uniref:Concanavalin A-like lectin/glucanase domain-containing protein n=1 Tax=Thelonectria olida TaxID=1576542 RepID=A0A9P9AV45_9HYPO|nr:concanavalin A-like lectin/glucanase domain-containing protein [Thelonectria olida]